jgi:hypothetical protein
VVIYNMYNGAATIDWASMDPATSLVQTLTNSYVEQDAETDAETCEASYFLVGSKKYEYDCNTMNTAAYDNMDPDKSNMLLDRNEPLEYDDGRETQKLYFDWDGYVIWAERETADPTQTGYVIVTSTSYGGYDKDNGYYMNIKGYDIEGNAISINGAFGDTDAGDLRYVYAKKEDATDYVADIAIYKYTYDEEAKLYNLSDADLDSSDADSAGKLMAGDPDAVSGDAVSDCNTVFVIANYNNKGAITGYTVKKGIKNIGDLSDADLGSKSSVIYDTAIDWSVTYVDDDTEVNKPDGDGLVDLVLVLGAKQSTDVSYKANNTKTDDVFYLLNTTPQKHFAEYNEYSVVMNGEKTTLKVDVNAEGGADGDYESEHLMDTVGFYKVIAWTGENAYEIVELTPAEIESVATNSDVLTYNGGEDLWEFASCHEGAGNGDYIVKADNCKIYDLTDGKIAPVDVIKAPADTNDGTVPTAQGVVADWDEYGFATLIYYVVVSD